MRITNNMMIANMMMNLNRTMLQLDKRQMQAYTGKRIHKPSDDPIAISRTLKVKTDISQLRQYDKNVDDAISWLETTELAVKNANKAVHRIRELMVQGGNGPLTVEETTKIQEEIKQIKEQLISLGNTSYGSSYIFSGKKTSTALFDAQGNYLVDLYYYKNSAYVDDRQDIQVGNYEKIGVNTVGLELFEAVERPVVYSEYDEVSLKLPLANDLDTSVITLVMENGEKIEITLEINTSAPEAVTKTIGEDGKTASVTLNAIGDEDSQINAIIGALKEMGEEYGSPLKGYDFSKFEANELNGTNVENVLRIKATPKDAMGLDTRRAQATWQTGEITPPVFDGDNPVSTFTFMGVTLNIRQGDSLATPDFLHIDELTKNGATIIVDGSPNSQEYAEAIESALSEIAKEDGSKIAGFTFSSNSTAGLQVVAPENTGNTYNKEVFAGSLIIANTDISSQLVVHGDAEKHIIAKGQKAGVIQLIDNLEKHLLEGNTDEIANQLDAIDRFHQNLLRVQSEVGAKVNRMGLVKERAADDIINFRNLQSQLEDADMGEVLMELINEENVYRAALSVGARIIQPTLLDFLR